MTRIHHKVAILAIPAADQTPDSQVSFKVEIVQAACPATSRAPTRRRSSRTEIAPRPTHPARPLNG